MKKKKNKLPLILVSCWSRGGNRGCVCCPGFFNRTPTTCGGGIIILASLPSCFLSLSISVVRHISLAHIPLSFAIVFTNRQAGSRWKPLRVSFSFGSKKESRNSFKQQLPMFVVDLLADVARRDRDESAGDLLSTGRDFFLRVVSLSQFFFSSIQSNTIPRQEWREPRFADEYPMERPARGFNLIDDRPRFPGDR